MAFGVFTLHLWPYQSPNGALLPIKAHALSSSDSFATVSASGYLNANVSQQIINELQVGDYVFATTSQGNVLFSVAISNGVVTLNQVSANANAAISTLISPDPQSDLIWYDITAGHAALASGGSVTVQASSGSKQYIVRNILVNYLSAGLSGGGGDRLLQLTDGTTSFNNAGITAALLGTPVNTVWGGSGNPLPGNVAISTPSAAGANIVLKYAGGTTDYSAGSALVSVCVQRVA